MLDMGFQPALRRILPLLPKERQTLLFSATFAPEVVKLSEAFTRDPQRVDVSAGQPMASLVTHLVHPVTDQRKGDLLKHIIETTGGAQALVFCRTKHGSNRVGQSLERAGINAGVIHGNKSQGARTKALADFKSGRSTVLVATDIAARGLDIAQLPLVINYDLPLVPEDYIHRAGRTGRAGQSGRAVSLVSHEDRDLLRRIQRLLPSPIEHVAIEGFAVSAPAHDRPAIDQRHHHGARPNRFGGHNRAGARHRRHGASSRVQAASRRAFARG
jgi:ATP-dependent RNA helicase RhlE